jgi:hypothetical protein
MMIKIYTNTKTHLIFEKACVSLRRWERKERGGKIPIKLNCCVVMYTYLITRKSMSGYF